MLNYLGPSIGPNGPITNQLPPATPGTMPMGVPKATPSPAPLPVGPMPHGHAAHVAHGHHAGINPDGMAAILNHPAIAGGSPPPPPEYGTTTQVDGSILLHVKNPDGSLGPVVKVLPPIKRSGPQP